MAVNTQIAFNPQGETVAITAAATAPNGVQALPYEKNKQHFSGIYRFVNAGSDTIWLGWGPTEQSAEDRSEDVPASGNPGAAIPLLPGAIEVLRFSATSYFSAHVTTGTQPLYITPGEGL